MLRNAQNTGNVGCALVYCKVPNVKYKLGTSILFWGLRMSDLSGFSGNRGLHNTWIFLLFLLFLVFTLPAQSADNTLAQRLGYSSDARLLIVHADDLGVAHSVNQATLDAMLLSTEDRTGTRTGDAFAVNSGSIMVPCPWFPEIAALYKTHPELDLGLHLTLTSEWKHYRWSGVLTDKAASGLHDKDGFLYRTVEEVVRNASDEAVEREIRAQLQRALNFGIQPTHLDSHMGTLFQTPGFFSAYLRLGREFGLPVLLPAEALEAAPAQLRDLISSEDLLIDRIVMAGPEVRPENWDAYYSKVLRELKPGITEIIIHLGYEDSELKAVTVDHPDYGAAWREADFRFFTSEQFRFLLKRHDIQLITWREIGSLLKNN